MQFTSNIIAAAIQNISKQKSGTDNPAITQDDVINTMRLAYLTIYPGNTLLNTSLMHAPLGYNPQLHLYYLKGTSPDQAKINWRISPYCARTTFSKESGYNQPTRSSIKYTSTPTASSNIYSTLSIGSGDVKMLLECTLWYPWHENYYFSPNNPQFPNGSTMQISPRDAFGFLMLTPQSHDTNSNYKSNFFYGVTIFTPIGSAFSETTAPQ